MKQKRYEWKTSKNVFIPKDNGEAESMRREWADTIFGVKKKPVINPTKRQMRVIKDAWGRMEVRQDEFWDKVRLLEARMSEGTGIKDLEFFVNSLGEIAGIGNASRTMKLWQPK